MVGGGRRPIRIPLRPPRVVTYLGAQRPPAVGRYRCAAQMVAKNEFKALACAIRLLNTQALMC